MKKVLLHVVFGVIYEIIIMLRRLLCGMEEIPAGLKVIPAPVTGEDNAIVSFYTCALRYQKCLPSVHRLVGSPASPMAEAS